MTAARFAAGGAFDPLPLARSLIRRRSVSPEDGGCQEQLISRLEALGFSIERLPFGEVTNLWARRGDAAPLVCFAGHTDVVPPGPEDAWRHPPFAAEVADGFLYGRGAADMKGSVAAFQVALEAFVADHPAPHGSIALLITSDEEQAAIDGTRRVVEHLTARGEGIDYCLVGEPSSARRLADTVKNGRRGSLGAVLTVRGIQGHVAYPHKARNPIHEVLPALQALAAEPWDEGNAFFPPTSFQISNLNAGTGANNVIPGELVCVFNLRFSTELTQEVIEQRAEAILAAHGLDFEVRWHLSGPPFLTPGGPLVEAVLDAAEAETGRRPELSTAGGTSDGRFVAPTGAHVVEIGPRNETIHKVDERVAVDDLRRLAAIYYGVLERLLACQQPLPPVRSSHG